MRYFAIVIVDSERPAAAIVDEIVSNLEFDFDSKVIKVLLFDNSLSVVAFHDRKQQNKERPQ